MGDLIQSEIRYSMLVETIPYGIEEIDVLGTILFANTAYHKMFGYSHGELNGKSKFDLVATKSSKDLLRDYLAFLTEKQPPPEPFFTQMITKKGALIDVEIAWNYRRDVAGKVIGFISVITDITDITIHKEALQNISIGFGVIRGKNFFTKITSYLTDTLHVDYAFIAEPVNDDIMMVTAGFGKGKKLKSFEYVLEGSPCKEVLEKGICVYPSDVQKLFPEDRLLVDMGVNGYIGNHLIDVNGNLVGIIVLMNEKPILNHEIAKSTVRIFSESIASEIRHLESETKIAKSEAQYKDLFEKSPIGIYLTKPDGTIVNANPALLEMLEYDSLHDLQNRNLSEEGYSKQSSIPRQKFIKMIEKDGFVKGLEGSWVTQKGNTIRVRENSQLRRANNGEILFYDGTVEDITESKKAEAKMVASEMMLRDINENSPDIITTVDKDLNITYINRVLFGFRYKDVIGASILNYVPEAYKEKYKQYLFKAFSGKKQKFEIEAFGKLGIKVWYSVRMASLNENNEINAVLIIATDITESKLAINKMIRTKEKLRALAARIEKIREEERTYIAREIHDELGHSLTALLIDLHSLGNKTEFQNNESTKELDSMIELVNQSINTIRKIASDLRPGILDKLGLGTAIEWQLGEFQKRNKIDCILDMDDRHLGEISKEKETALFRIFQELLTNISKHAKATKVTVILKVKYKKIRLDVSDNGVGIQNKDIEKIESLGILGMKERVSQFKGEFFINKHKKEGTDVKILIPINN